MTPNATLPCMPIRMRSSDALNCHIDVAMIEALAARKGRRTREEYVADSRPEGIEKKDMVGEPGKVSPTDSASAEGVAREVKERTCREDSCEEAR